LHNRPRQLVMFAALAAFALAACCTPAAVVPGMQVAARAIFRAWSYWWSMLLGASPFLIAGGASAALLGALPARWKQRALPLAAVCLPLCDCAVNSCALEFARLPPRVAALAITLGASSNVLALASTWFILGPHLAACRAACGLAAAIATAFVWGCERRDPACAHPSPAPFVERMTRATGTGIITFSAAAAIASVALVLDPHEVLGRSPAAALGLGMLLSPCSSADALLARSLFSHPKAQLAFVVASQCLDVRQMLVLVRQFGWRRALQAFGCAAIACGLGYGIA
jgi:uncharacterized membrane protein YraQ (UPF0718 family)